MEQIIAVILVSCFYAALSTKFEVPILPHDSPATMTLVISSTNAQPTTNVSVRVIQNGSTIRSNGVYLSSSNRYYDTFTLDVNPVTPGVANMTNEPTRISVSSPGTFQLQVYTEVNQHVEGYNAIPSADVGSEYFLSSFCSLGGFCQLAVLPVGAGVTQVYIGLPPEVNEVRVCSGNLTWDSAFHDTINLTSPDVLRVETTHNIAGTHIYADGPISVVVGTRQISQSGDVYHMLEQLHPTSEWGMSYQYSSTGRSDYGDIVQIISCERHTIVEMEGYSTVKLPVRGGVIERRIAGGVVAVIRSNKPVQVAVIVGIRYGGNDGSSSIAMSLVPPTESFKNSYTIGFFGNSSSLNLATMQGSVSLNGGNEHNSTLTSVPYSEFGYSVEMAVTETRNILTLSDSTDSNTLGGVIGFGSALLLPEPISLTTPSCLMDQVEHYPGDMVDNDCNGQTDEYACQENLKLFLDTPSANASVRTSAPLDISMFAYLNFRILTCGVATLRLDDAAGNAVFIQIRHERITLLFCTPICDTSEEIVPPLNTFRCDRDMLAYTLFGSGTFLAVSSGFDTKTLAVKELPGKLVSLTFGTVDNSSTFWYDIMYPDCQKLSSDWRCDDMVTNCNEYDQDICNDVTHLPWASFYCRKYCQICSPDSYGKMFVAVSYPLAPVMSLDVVPRDPAESPSVLGYSDSILTRTDYNASSGNHVNYVRLSAYSDLSVYLYSENDVSVKVLLSGISEVPLHPFDAFGTTYMTLLMTTGDEAVCRIVPADLETRVWQISSTDRIDLGVFNPVEFSEVTLPSSELNGLIFEASKPVAVFCGAHLSNSYFSWYQLAAVNTWGKRYVTPLYNVSDGAGLLRVLASSDNTWFNISGGFDGAYSLPNKGGFTDFPFDPSITYFVSSNYPVAVGLQYYRSAFDISDANSTFILLPPTEQFMTSSTLYIGPGLMSYWDSDISITRLLANDTDVTHESGSVYPDSMYGYNVNDMTESTFITAFTTCSYSTCSFLSVQLPTLEYTDLTQVMCHVITDGLGDGVDNDCDGLADEDKCVTGYGTTREDHDFDGAFGEDCSESSGGTPTVTPPEAPICTTLELPEEGCWNICKCACSWVNSLQEYENMNDAEREEYLRNKTARLVHVLAVEKDSLAATQAQSVSAEDERTSSKNMGFVGVAIIVLVLGIIVGFDIIGLVQKFNRWRQTDVSD